MRFFFDTEFSERRGSMELISIGIVAEDGREFYTVSSEFDPSKVNDWVRDNVLPKLPESKDRLSYAEIGKRILDFVGKDKPEFWAYFADYDWVLFCWCFGSMVELPGNWPRFCMDFKQFMHDRGLSKRDLPKQDKKTEHDALADARWLRDAWNATSRTRG